MRNLSGIALKFGLGLCTVFLVACSDEERLIIPDSKLAGKITYKGKPVPHAMVIVTALDGIAATGDADADGNYQVEHAPEGEVQVGVNTDAGRGKMMSATMAAAQSDGKSSAPEFVDVPKKFHNPATSGLTTTVTSGAATTAFDIEIK